MSSAMHGSKQGSSRTQRRDYAVTSTDTGDATSPAVARAATREKKLSATHSRSRPPTAARKLTAQQIAELLKAFWVDLLQNNVRQVRKMLAANMLSMDFRAARYVPAAGGSALHLCAQHGHFAMARMLVEFNVADVDAQNKVGSTPLHVACKFGQEALLLFLLELGARVDIPDSQNRVAFDVAPFEIVDRCILAPLREQQRVAQHENDELRRQHASASMAVDDASQECCNAEMAFAEAEGWAVVEREMLTSIRNVDNDWNTRLQREREELERHRAAYREQLSAIEESRERIDETRVRLVATIEHDKKVAQEEVDRLTQCIREIENALTTDQQELDDQLGLIDAANALPNSPEVQEWTLSVMLALIEEDERCLPDGRSGTRSIRLLARDEAVDVIVNVLVRFSATRHLQRCALQCLSALISHVITVISTQRMPVDERGVLQTFLDRFFSTKTRKISVTSLCRDVLARDKEDVEMNALVATMLCIVLRARSSNDTPIMSMRFSHERRNQRLPLDMLLLYERARRLGMVSWTEEAWINAVRDAAFLLFTVTKANATKALLTKNVVATVICWIHELALLPKQLPSADARRGGEVKAAAIQYLLGSLSFLHSVPWLPTANVTVAAASGEYGFDFSFRMLEEIHSWNTGEIQRLLAAVSPILQTLDTTASNSAEVADLVCPHRMGAGFWTLKLLRNLTLHHGEAARAVRIELFAFETFSLLSEMTSALLRLSVIHNRQLRGESDDSASRLVVADAAEVPGLTSIVGVWMDLAESVWIRHYDADGRLRVTVDFAIDHVLHLVSWLPKHLSDFRSSDLGLAACSRILNVLALVLSNGKNARLVRSRNAVIDDAVRTFLRWMLRLRAAAEILDGSESQSVDVEHEDSGVTSTHVFEVLVFVLRIYLASLNDQLSSCVTKDDCLHRLAVQQLHDRCREVGVCVILHAFRSLEIEREDKSEGQEKREASSPSSGGHLGSIKRLRTVTKSKITIDHSASDERRVLFVLCRAVAELSRCTC